MDLSSISDIKMSSLLQNSSTHKILSIPLTEIQCLDQVRTNSNKGFDDDSIDELAQSIKNTGLLQPITVRPNPDGQGYLVLWGERRFRACKKLDLKEIDCIVREDLTKEDDIVLAQFLENEQRNDLSLMEKAAALHRLFEAGIKKKDLAEKLGMPNSNITYILGCYNLDQYVIDLINSGHLSDSPRLVYDFSKLLKEHPDEVKEFTAGLIARSDDPNVPYQIIRPDISLMREMIERKDSVNLNDFADTASEEDNSPADDSDELSEQQNSDDEYSVINEREHSAEPEMASAEQDNYGSTAKVGSSSDFSDKDTKASHDLSDSISYSEESNEDLNSSSEENLDLIEGFLAEYHGENYVFNLEKGADEEHILIINSKGVASEVLLKEVKFIRVL